jgi:HAE1 family hydrophobic/amphiphilic exporter-1
MIADFFIARPVLANVLAILIMVIGGVALFKLPVAQYPDVVPPTVQVTTRYPGASARAVIDSVALPIEQQVNGVDGMIYMQSYSGADGSYSLTVTFRIGFDINVAQILVQNRVSSALASLPQAVQSQGVVVQKNSPAILQIVTLTSPDARYDSLYLANYATINMKDALARLPGVGNVLVFGAGQYSMRVWLDPEKMHARSLVPQDVIQALQQQSVQVTAGQVGMPPAPAGQTFQYTINVAGKLTDTSEFANVIVKTGRAGEVTRLRDVGSVELGAQTYSQVFNLDGKPAAGLAIFQAPGANALEVANEVRSMLGELSRSFPQGLVSDVPFDTTKFVKQSIHEVYKTLFEAAILVLVVILIFLQDWRATLVPATTVPVTIIGAFAAMAALGFTVNFSTLFAIVLAIGIVVDDAIVVVEGAVHNIERGMTGREAASQAMRALFGPIMGITLVLMSVFLPAAFLPGLSGRMYAQFALVIAATALISAINAATLKPTQSAMWLRPAIPPERRNVFYRAFNRGYAALERGYTRLIDRMIERSTLMVVLALALLVAAGYGFTRVPTGFLPIEDQGYLIALVQLPQGASLERTQAAMTKVFQKARTAPGVAQVITIAGVSPLDNSAALASSGVAYIILKDWSERGKAEGLVALFNNLNASLGAIEEAQILVMPPPPIQGVGNDAGFTMQIQLRDGSFDMAKLQSITDRIIANAKSQSALQLVLSSFRANVPQYTLEVDRIKTETLQVSLDQVFSVLAGYLGSSYVDQFNKFGRVFQIYVQGEPEARVRLEDIRNLTVRNKDGDMIPLGTLVKIIPTAGPSLISLYNLYPSSTIIGLPAQGFSSGEVLAIMEQIAARTLPPGTGFEWSAMSYQEKLVGNQMYLVFGLALLLVYLVLAGQYESWYAPVSVILAVPLSFIGPVATFAALISSGLSNNLYVQIGLVLLMALSAKNAILIVEFARELRHEGRPLREAALEAARGRLRAILMTSLAFILGVLPLVLATGAGASARKSIGITVFTGMIASTCLAVLFVPSFFIVVQRFEEWRKAARKPAVPTPAPSRPEG